MLCECCCAARCLFPIVMIQLSAASSFYVQSAHSYDSKDEDPGSLKPRYLRLGTPSSGRLMMPCRSCGCLPHWKRLTTKHDHRGRRGCRRHDEDPHLGTAGGVLGDPLWTASRQASVSKKMESC